MANIGNVTPRKFGKGGNEPQDWTCVCGHINKGRVVKKKANRIVCWMCELDKDYLDNLAKEIREYDG